MYDLFIERGKGTPASLQCFFFIVPTNTAVCCSGSEIPFISEQGYGVPHPVGEKTHTS